MISAGLSQAWRLLRGSIPPHLDAAALRAWSQPGWIKAGMVHRRRRARSAVRRELDIPFEGVTDDATFWVADLRGVRGLPDNSMAAWLGDATFGVAFPLGPAGHTRPVALAPGDDIGQEQALAAAVLTSG